MGSPHPPDAPDSPETAAALAAALRRAVAAGTISAEQAEAVLAAERVHPAPTLPGGRRLPLTEAIGYLGGLLALSGAVTLVLQYWQEVPVAGRLALLAAVSLATWLVGARIADGSAPALIRLRGVIWLASSVAVAAFAGQAVADLADADTDAVLLAAGGAAALHGALLWRRRDRPAQVLACLAGTPLAGGAAAAVLDSGGGVVGLVVAVVGALWVLAGWLRVAPPPVLTLVGGAVAVFVGTAITSDDWADAAPLLGLCATVLFVALGIGGDRTALTVMGLLGSFVYLPWTMGQFFADSLGVPLAMLICGVILLVATLVLLRRPSRRAPL